MSDHIIARFVPQAWQDDYAVEVDAPGGPDCAFWDVTEHVLSMPRHAALMLRDDDYMTDELRFLDSAPMWMAGWQGPFYIQVEEAIREYFDAHPEEP